MAEYVCSRGRGGENCVAIEAYCANNNPSITNLKCFYLRQAQPHNLSFQSTSNRKTILSNSSNYLYYTDKITDTSVDPPQIYDIKGVAHKIKSGNKVLLYFNGSGYRPKIITDSDGKKIETTYKVYSKMQGELCKNGNIKIYLNEENGETNNAKEDGKDIVYDSSYSSESSFCLKKIK